MYGNLYTCEVQYVKPGSDFQIPCKSDHATDTRIYQPGEEVPSDEQLAADSLFQTRAERTTTISEYEDATKGVDDGFYTCFIRHGPRHEPAYSLDTCQVIIVDLCEDSGCGDKEICEPDYSTGTVECTCDYKCPFAFNALCTDTCEVFWHECAMEERVCQDGKERQVAHLGFCLNRVEPTIRDIDQEIEAELGEFVTLASGLIKDGTPMATIHWVFYPDNGEPSYLSVRENYRFQVTEDSVGTYRITLTHCMNTEAAVRNEYRFGIKRVTTSPPVETTSPTPGYDLGELKLGGPPGYTCSAFPGGVLEDFNSRAHFYDLSCTHILAADMMPGGYYVNPWFIYGTFDTLDGNTALMHMTFYLGRNIFEVQRGWIVHTGSGNKLELDEGLEQPVPNTECTVKYSDLHIRVNCPLFEAYYDGLMSGHIKLKGDAGTENLRKGRGNIGLCFDSNSGWRPNWQVGRMRGQCKIDVEEPSCESEGSDTCQLSRAAQPEGSEWSSCGVGAEGACKELNCGGATPTPQQKCALQKANRINCSLKLGRGLFAFDAECPEEECDWKQSVYSQGCPQEYLPFDC